MIKKIIISLLFLSTICTSCIVFAEDASQNTDGSDLPIDIENTDWNEFAKGLLAEGKYKVEEAEDHEHIWLAPSCYYPIRCGYIYPDDESDNENIVEGDEENTHKPKQCEATIEYYLPHKVKRKCEFGYVCEREGCPFEIPVPLASLFLKHDFTKATCAKPATCQYCGATTGVTLQHEYVTDKDGNVYCKNCQATKTKLLFTSSNKFEATIYTPACNLPGSDEEGTDKYVIYFPGSGESLKSNYERPDLRNAIFANGKLTAEDLNATVYNVAYGNEAANSATDHAAQYDEIIDNVVADYMSRHPESTVQDAYENIEITSMGFSLGSDDGYFFREYWKNKKISNGVTGEDNSQFIGTVGLGHRGLADLKNKAAASEDGVYHDPNMHFIVLNEKDMSNNVNGRPNQARKFVDCNYYVPESEGKSYHGTVQTNALYLYRDIINGDSQGNRLDNFEGVPTFGNRGGTANPTTTTPSPSKPTTPSPSKPTTPSPSKPTDPDPEEQEEEESPFTVNCYDYELLDGDIVKWKFICDNDKEVLSKDTKYTDAQFDAYESILNYQIEEAGNGTRSSVVAAARFLAGLGKAVPYSSGDQEHRYYTKLGLNKKWGSGYGLDCTGYVSWVIKNSGLERSNFIFSTTEEYKLKNYYKKIKPGDILQSIGYRMMLQSDGTRKKSDEPTQTHIYIAIGVDDKNIYVAEESGNQLKIREISITQIEAGYLNNSYSKGSIEFVRPLKDDVPEGNNLTNMWNSKKTYTYDSGKITVK